MDIKVGIAVAVGGAVFGVSLLAAAVCLRSQVKLSVPCGLMFNSH